MDLRGAALLMCNRVALINQQKKKISQNSGGVTKDPVWAHREPRLDEERGGKQHGVENERSTVGGRGGGRYGKGWF